MEKPKIIEAPVYASRKTTGKHKAPKRSPLLAFQKKNTGNPSFPKVSLTSGAIAVALICSTSLTAQATPFLDTKDSEDTKTQTVDIPVQSVSVSAASVSHPVEELEAGYTATPIEEVRKIQAEKKAAEEAAAAEQRRIAAEQAAALQRISNTRSGNVATGAKASAGAQAARSTGVAPGQIVPASGIISAAQQWVGVVPYGHGNHPNDSFSCDGYVQYVFSQNGINLPRGVSAQAATGTRISASEAKAGDLLIWPGQHVAIYDGNGGMYDSPKPGRMVQHRTTIWGSPYFVRI
jgi:cell wall-associated NlpC family hydrolase